MVYVHGSRMPGNRNTSQLAKHLDYTHPMKGDVKQKILSPPLAEGCVGLHPAPASISSFLEGFLVLQFWIAA